MKKSNMHRLALFCALIGLGGAGWCRAEEPSLCTSLCASQKQECKRDALEATENDTSNLLEMEEKNPYARNAARAQVVPEMTRTAERSAFQKRKQERFDACDTGFRQCNRACAASSSSVVIKKAGDTR